MNGVLEMQLKEKEKEYEKAMLLNPKTRGEFLRLKAENERKEKLDREYYRKKRLLG